MRTPRGTLLLVGLFLFFRAGVSGQTITEFPIPTAGSGPAGIGAGPDGNLWFTELNANNIGRITPAGVVTEFPIPVIPSRPAAITAGSDGNLWFVENLGNRIGRATTAGVITGFGIPTPSSGANDITAGPGGTLWFTETLANKVGRITTAGVITEFSIPTVGSRPADITAGPDGNLWFTEFIANKIGRITPAGVVTEFPLPTPASSPGQITAGPDGNLWFTQPGANRIGRITPAGVITEFPIPTAASSPGGITAGPDGNVWFTEEGANKIARVNLQEPEPEPEPDTLRIIPVVGSTPGAGGSFFKTSVQLHNPGSEPITGLVVFHPSGAPGGDTDPRLFFLLASRQTTSNDDLLPLLGRSGLGSADVRAVSGALPVLSIRVFNDAGTAGTTGFTEEAMRPSEALLTGQEGVLILPADLTNFRFNLGVRTLEATAATFTVRNSGGFVAATVSRVFPATYHEQQTASAFLGVATLPAGGTISVIVGAGSAILYGATVDNRTGDPSLQIARAAP